MPATVTRLADHRDPQPPTDEGPANSAVDDGDHRTYTHPITGESWTSVTTLLKATPKDGLPYWAAREVADAAYDQIPRLVKATRTRPCGKGTSDDRCHECPDCVRYALRLTPEELRDEAGDRGRRVHKVADMWAKTGELNAHDDDIVPYVQQYLAWAALMKPTYEGSEATVINRRHGYAGTLDGLIRLGWAPPKYQHLIGQLLVADIKTSKSVHTEAAMQLAAYRHGEAIMLPDGTELPMPDTVGAIVIHIRPDGFQTHFVEAGAADLDGFLTVASLYRWLNGRGKTAIERAMYKPRKPPAITAPPAAQPATKPAPAPALVPEPNPFAEFPGDEIPF